MSTPNKENQQESVALPQPVMNLAQIVPYIQQQNAVQIPNEYDFDILELMNDLPEDGHNAVLQQIPQNQVATMTNTANTQINVQKNVPEMPGFHNCSIDTINFNILPK